MAQADQTTSGFPAAAATGGHFRLTQLLTANAAARPNATAVRQDGRSLSWSGFEHCVQQVAGALRAHGVGAGDRVAVLAQNSDLYAILYFAIPWAGAVLVPLNTRLAETELAAMLEDAAAKVLLTDASHRAPGARLQASVAGLDHLLDIDPDAAVDGVPAWANTAPSVQDAGRADEDPAVLCFTGGTTGRPKAVVLSHRGLVAGGLQWQGVARLDVGDSMLMIAPLFHLAGLSNTIGAVLVGASIEVAARFDPGKLLDLIERQQINYAVLVPAMIAALVDHPELAGHNLSCLQRITYGGAPIDPALLARSLERLPHTAFVQIYGQTESGVSTALMPADHVPGSERIRSAGRAVAGVALRIVDGDGAPQPAGTWGEICLRSPGMAAGYWQRPEETASTFQDGWLHTGDIGWLDGDAYLTIVDRAKDMIISGGENVYSVEVEQALDSHPAVLESAAVGVPSERWGEAVHVVVRLVDGAQATDAELVAHCRSQLAGYKCPQAVTFHDAPLPRTAIGKLLKRDLRAELLARHAASTDA